ncbi:uncharacterized protein LOC5498142 isoform X2 [Nematostella vectensis]|uniref:uncharacterized protein LOC5498142 isoform X2 n=1 Tax=Nematostella vectensis TaxID=45351 RepID=UPI0020777020|nr:uncharacterized protein LOC5498142 isoform X2 [Nematostella vectensis]
MKTRSKCNMYSHKKHPNFGRDDANKDKPWAKTGAYFLGPNAENGDVFKRQVVEAIDGHIKFREHYFPQDPDFITDEMKDAPSYRETIRKMSKEINNMHGELQKSVPFFSSRYKGHVTWDTLMAANLGYMVALMYNQNNCAAEASTVTTKFEVGVGRDLCTMIDFDPDKAMGHIVAGGSVANIEGMWAARNVKFYPLGLCDAIRNEEVLAKAKGYKVFLPHRNVYVAITDCTTWELLNLDVDIIVEMPDKVSAMCGMTSSDLLGVMANYGYDAIGIQNFCARHGLKQNPCVLAPTTAHVSLYKGCTILGMGKGNLITIPVDDNARMCVKGLRDLLEDKLANKIPVVSVIAIMGTTEESAVDPLTDILELRNEMRRRGLNFMIHADGAWGGYFCTMLRTPPKPEDDGGENPEWFVPEMHLSNYTTKQLSAIPHVDTITIDPHKSGFCPYPGGAICYRDKRINNFLGITNQVVYYHGSLNLGDVGIEGSKPGAVAAGISMAHRVVGLHKNGYGRILAECTFTSKLLYCLWTCLGQDDDPFFVVPTKPLPPDRTREEHIKFMRARILNRPNEELAQDAEAMEYLREIGPDTMIPCFSFNLKNNSDVNLCNDLVQAVFKDLCMSDDRVSSYRFPMLVTASTHPHHNHSISLREFKKRLGLDPYDTTGVKYIITTCMDPWATSIDFVDDLGAIMRNAILNAIGTVTDPNVHHDFITTGQLTGDKKNKHMICYYAGQFPAVSHQYCAAFKIQFFNSAEGEAVADAAAKHTEPLTLRSVEQERLHDLLLYDFDEGDSGRHEPEVKVDCYYGLPTEGKAPFMRTTVRVVDVARFDHFDHTVKEYPESSRYFMYGSADKAFLMHIPTIQPDFLQLVELSAVPEGVSPLILQHGAEIEMPFPGTPQTSGKAIVDPLDKSQYEVRVEIEGGAEIRTKIDIAKKIWFDGSVVNGIA